MSIFLEGYLGSKLAEVHHLQGNQLIFALWNFNCDDPISNDNYRQDTLSHLEKARELPDFGAMNTAILEEILKMATDTDWNDKESYQAFVDFVNAVLARPKG